MNLKIAKKLGLTLCLSTMMFSSFQVLASTNNQLEEPTTVSIKDFSENPDEGIQPIDSKVVINQSVYAAKNTPSPAYTWQQTKGFEWIRIWYKNDADYDVVIKFDGSLPKTIYAHSEGGYVAHPVSAGTHKVTIAPVSGGEVDGWIGVREGDSEDF